MARELLAVPGVEATFPRTIGVAILQIRPLSGN